MGVIYLKSINDLKEVVPGTNLVLGLFDGVHIGHFQLINAARYMTKGSLSILTFDVSLKSNDRQVLLSLDDKVRKFLEMGVDYVYVFMCDEHFREISADDFINNILKKFAPNKIFCGPDFKFGYKALGNVDLLKQTFANVVVLNYVNDYDETKISSSIIKQYIRNGEIENANRFLGYDYYVKGIVVKGKKNGHKFGFPTINLELVANYVIPKDGVYITKTIIGNRVFPSMTNVGTHPTIDELSKPLIETHILGFDENIYGEEVSVKFYKKIRDEIHFENIEDLKNELYKNEQEVEKYFEITL